MPLTKESYPHFNRSFNPEYLGVRRDVSQIMLSAAKGDLATLKKHFEEEGEAELSKKNREGNTLLIMAVANQHIGVVEFLVEQKADLFQKNRYGLDAMDFAAMYGIRSPILKLLMNNCLYVVPECPDGSFWKHCNGALTQLTNDRVYFVKTSVIGKTPPIVQARMENRKDEAVTKWLASVSYFMSCVKHGMLLLSSDIGYLEGDALAGGCLEVPADKRFVYVAERNQIVPYAYALRSRALYASVIEDRVLQGCIDNNPVCVLSLLRARVSPEVQDLQGSSLLMHAARRGSTEAVRCLIESRAKIADSNQNGYTPLLLAAVGEHGETVRLLLRMKANPLQTTYKGITVLAAVKHEGLKDIEQIIAEEQLRGKDRPTRMFAPGPRKK